MQLRLIILCLLLPITLATYSCMEPYDLSRSGSYKRTLMQHCQDETKKNMYPEPEKASKQDKNKENEYESGSEKGTSMPQAGSEKLGKEMEGYKQDGYKPVYEMGTGMPQNGSDKLGKEMEYGYKPVEDKGKDMPKNGSDKTGKEKEDCDCNNPVTKTTTEVKTKTILHDTIETKTVFEMKKPASSTKIIFLTEIHRATPVPSSIPMLGSGKLGLPIPMPSGAPPMKPVPIMIRPSGAPPMKPVPIMIRPSGRPISITPKPSGVLPPPRPSGAPIPIPMPKPVDAPKLVAPNPVIKPQPPSTGTAKLVGTSAPLVTAPANFKSAAASTETQNFAILVGLMFTIPFLL